MIHIKYETCPDCGSELRAESRNDRHINGHWNESRTFCCGAKYEFSPNFMRTDQTVPCSNTDDSKAKRMARLLAKQKLDDYIKTMDADSEFKLRVIGCLSYVHFN